jgi:hypothetical protein
MSCHIFIIFYGGNTNEFMVFHFAKGTHFSGTGVAVHGETPDLSEEDEIASWSVLISDSLMSIL